MDLFIVARVVFDPRVSCFAAVYLTAMLRSDEKERFFFHRSRGAFLNIAPVGNTRRRKTRKKGKRSMNEKQNSTLTIEKVFVRWHRWRE